MRNWLFVFSAILSTFSPGSFDPDCSSRKQLTPVRLKNALLCGYDSTIRPVMNHQNATTVVVRMVLKYFTYDMHTNTMTVHNWLTLYWKDQHLKWSPKDYDGIDYIHLSTDEIWVPDLSIYNRNDQSGSPSVVGSVECAVYSTGTVVCVPPTRQDALCISDVSRYPFDVHNCTLRYGSWVHSGEEINFVTEKQAISLDDFESNKEWQLLNVSVTRHDGRYKCCPNNTYPSIAYTFILKRHSAVHMATVFIPLFVLALLTMTVLWMHPTSSDRLMLACCSLICHMLHFQFLAWELTINGDKTPLIIIFTRDALLMSGFSVILTIFLKNIISSNDQTPIPVWLTPIITKLVQSMPAQLILRNYSPMNKDELSTNIVEEQTISNQSHKEWLLVAKILDRLSFIGILLAYVIMFIAFMP